MVTIALCRTMAALQKVDLNIENDFTAPVHLSNLKYSIGGHFNPSTNHHSESFMGLETTCV